MTQVYVIPFVLYLFGTSFLARFGDAWYPLLYGGLVLGMLVCLWRLLVGKSILQPHLRVLPAV
ncbi:MAG: hypothetical protein ABI557_06185, partial [Aureliella sp.]